MKSKIRHPAVEYVAQRAYGSGIGQGVEVTVSFHPDLCVGKRIVIENLAKDGAYRSQFDTGVSSGDLSAFRGGDRWNWESRIFGAVYDENPELERPKYGGLNLSTSQFGASPRFGSCYLVLSDEKLADVTLCFPDSHLNPDHFGTADKAGFLEKIFSSQYSSDPLDDYVEAHVHGPLSLAKDVKACVIDPSFWGTPVETAARNLPCEILWHQGFVFRTEHLKDAAVYRGEQVARLLSEIERDGIVTPSMLSALRNAKQSVSVLKKAWHCIARFGQK